MVCQRSKIISLGSELLSAPLVASSFTVLGEVRLNLDFTRSGKHAVDHADWIDYQGHILERANI